MDHQPRRCSTPQVKPGMRKSAAEDRRHSLFLRFGLLVFFMAVLFAWTSLVSAAEHQSKQNEKVLRARLDNGLRVVIVRNSLAPVATTVINYMVGSNEAPEGFPGTAHAQEHMMFRGSPGLSAAQLANIIAGMGGMFDADTQQTLTQYFFNVPAEDLSVALHIGSIRMRGVLDSEELWRQERGAIEQEVARDLSNPEYVFYTKLLSTLFKGTPYAHDALGTVPSFNKTTGDMLKKFHDAWYAPNNAILVVAGDVQPEQVLKEIKQLFGDIPSKKLPNRPQIHLQTVQPETFNMKTDLPYGLATISFRLPGYDSPDYAAVKVLGDVLSSERGELYGLVPEGNALSTNFSIDTMPQVGLGYAVAAFPKGDDGEGLVHKMRHILHSYAKGGVPANLVEAAKRAAVTEAELQKNSVLGLAMAWSQALALEGKQSPDEQVKAIQQVTSEDVNRVAKKYLDLNHAVVAILTPQASGKPVASRGYGGKESFAPEHAKPVELPEWAEKALKRLSVPKSTVNPVVKTLPNGLKLIVQPTDVSDTVTVYGHVENKPELETPKGKEGVDQVLDELFSFGTTSLDRLAFQKALDDIGAKESAGTSFHLKVLTSHFDRGVELLADNQLHPALPEPAFTVMRKEVAAAVAGELESPSYLSEQALKAALFPKSDPTLRQATPDSVSALTLQDVKDYYRKVFRPDLTTIVVIGKVVPEDAAKVIEKYFGGWKATGPKPDVLLPEVPLNKASATVVPNVSRVQDKVTLAETLGLTRSNPQYYALELGNHVLSGAFYATRLYQDLREKSGLVYYVSSDFDLGRTRGIYAVEYGCDPPNVTKAQTIVEQNLVEMQTAKVSDQELLRAKTLLIRRIPLDESSVDRIAQGLLQRTILKLPLDEPIIAAEHYLKLDAEQVRAAYAKWLRPKALVRVSEGPQPQ